MKPSGPGSCNKWSYSVILIFLKAVKALHETMAFDKAIERALEMVDLKNTLVIVTADHSHVMTMAGYPSRGADIRGETATLRQNVT